MYFDISRDALVSRRNISRVVIQQGRVLVDADLNEQHALLLNQARMLARDLIGWHGGPGVAPGDPEHAPAEGCFAVLRNGERLAILPGRYYVDGHLIHFDGRDLPASFARAGGDRRLLIVVKCAERPWIVSSEHPEQDPALADLDTAGRMALHVQLDCIVIDDVPAAIAAASHRDRFYALLHQSPHTLAGEANADAEGIPRPRMVPSTRDNVAGDPWTPPAGQTASELENQLYRVEIHAAPAEGTHLWTGDPDDLSEAVTCKWSRDNGSVCYPVETCEGDPTTVELGAWWKHKRGSIEPGQWIELLPLARTAGVFAQVDSVHEAKRTVTFKRPQTQAVREALDALLHTPGEKIIRRWDHAQRNDLKLYEGAIVLRPDAEHESRSLPVPIEDGLSATFILPEGARFHAGDHWLMPARNGASIIWPRANQAKRGERQREQSSYVSQSARRILTHWAPLAIVTDDAILDLRRAIRPLTER